MTADRMGRRAAVARMAWGMAILAAPAGMAVAAGSGAGSRQARGGRPSSTARIAGTGVRIRIRPLDEASIGRGGRLAG